MKVLRVIGNIIIGLILFVSIFCLSFIKSTNNFLEKDLILGVVRASLEETINNEANKIKDGREEIIDEIFSDSELNDFVDIVINNFRVYQNDKVNFTISKNDIEKISSYAKKYKTQIIQISGDKIKDISETEFDEIFSSENINKFANKIYEKIDMSLGNEIDKVIEVYDKATSNKVAWILIGLIVFLIILLILINWSLYRWMLVPGICLIISGILMSLIFFMGMLLNDIISAEKVIKEAIGYISFNSYIVVGIIELVVGIIFVVAYNLLKNHKYNQQVNDLGNIDSI